jgi:hypothetical protein
MNRTWIVLLSLLSLGPPAVQAQFEYIVNADNAITITNYTGPPWNVAIPATINDIPVTSIGDHAAIGCSGLTSVAIGNSVTSIGEGAFGFCTGLTNIAIGSGVIRIGDAAFESCTNLTAITVDTNNSFYSSLNGVLFDKNQRALIRYPCIRGIYAIPGSVTSIGFDAFGECRAITKVTIPDGVRSIGYYAFYDCTSLTSVTIPSSVTNIAGLAFENSGLTSVTIPGSVTQISAAFGKCGRLTSVRISEGVASIGESAFEGCTNLTSVTIPSSVTNIGDFAFASCPNLASVTLPSGTSVSATAFEGSPLVRKEYDKGEKSSSTGIMASVWARLAGKGDADHSRAFLTALKRTQSYYEGTAGTEHPGLVRAMQAPGGNADSVAVWLGALMQKDYKSQVEASLNSLAEASRHFCELSKRSGFPSQLNVEFQTYSKIIQRNRTFFTSADTLDLIQAWANDYVDEDSLFQRISDDVAKLPPD